MITKPFFILATAIQLLSAVALHGQSPLLSPTMPVDPPDGANSNQSEWNAFGWQSFVAVNWPSVVPPASGISGQPDTSLTIGAAAANAALIPTTWLTWRTASSTFLPKAPDPGAWSNPQSTRSGLQSPAPGFSPMVLNMTSKLSNPIDDVDEAFAGPLIDQAGWYVIYDIRLNQSEYTYIRQYGYYDAVNQQQAFAPNGHFYGFPRNGLDSIKPGTPVAPDFPAMFNPPLPSWAQFGATEIKASWRVLDPVKDKAVIPRYYTQTGYFLQSDGTTAQGLFGLIGLHILRLTPSSPSTWFWATFEQVDNVIAPEGFNPTLAAPNAPNGNCGTATNVQPPTAPNPLPWNGKATPVDVCRVTPIPSDIQATNKVWQQALAGTVWANYQMVGVINPAVPGAQNPPKIAISNAPANTDTLANVSMETYFQGAHSDCMGCHASSGFPQFAPLTSDFQVFTFLLTNADSSQPGLVKRQGLRKAVLEKFRAALRR